MSNRIVATPFSSLSITAATIAIILSIASLWIAVHADVIVRPSEDDLGYLYYSSIRSVNTARYDELGQAVGRLLNSTHYADHLDEVQREYYAYRFDERQRLVDNYPLLSRIMQGVRLFTLERLASGTIVYPEALTRIINISLHATITLTVLVFGGALFFVRRDGVVSIALGMVTILAMDRFSPWQQPIWILHVRPHDIGEVVERVIQTVLLVFSASGMESSFPRGNFLILVLPVFLLRWSSCYSSSYVLVSIAGLVHSAMGSLLFMCLLASDLLLRREVLRSRVVLSALVFTFWLFFSRSLISKAFGIQASMPVLGLALVAGLALAMTINYLVGAKFPVMLDVASSRIRSTGPVLSDLIVLYAMWVVLLPISISMYFLLGGASHNLWTWRELPGRYLLLMRGPLIMGLLLSLVELLQRQHHMTIRVVAIISLLVSGGLFMHALNIPGALARTPLDLPRQFVAREQTSIRAEQGERFEYVEADIYFSAARAIDLDRPFPMQLLGYTAGACRRRQYACE